MDKHLSGRAGFRPCLGVLLVAWLASSCAHTGTGEPPAASAPGTEASQGSKDVATTDARDSRPDLTRHMQANFFLAIDARDALIDGDLEEARKRARLLATQATEGDFPAAWQPYLARMKQHADGVVLAADPAEAGKELGLLAITCGNCHWYAQQGPDAPREPPLPFLEPPDNVGERMFRHEVGADQMWTGMITPSEDDYRAGTITLTRAPLSPPEGNEGAVDPEYHAAIERIRDLAKQSRAATTHEQRAELYGTMITECASCHLTQPKPGP